jgi:hypothetical protein
LLLNLIFTNSRTPIAIFFIGLFILMLFTLNIKKIFRYVIVIILIGAAVYTNPIVQERIDNTLDIFETGGTAVGGSNVGVRLVQFGASYIEFQRSPYFGNGFRYITENLGYSRDSGKGLGYFGGFESYIYALMIEQGLLGIIAAILFYWTLTYYFIKKRKLSSNYSGLGVTIIIMFLTFSIATGTLDTWRITMSMLGVIVKLIEISYNSQKNKIELARQ